MADIPLGMPFDPDPMRVAHALDFPTAPWPFGFAPLGRRGIGWRCTDIDPVWGQGAQIREPAAALMMSGLSHTAQLDALNGAGMPLLRHRLAR